MGIRPTKYVYYCFRYYLSVVFLISPWHWEWLVAACWCLDPPDTPVCSPRSSKQGSNMVQQCVILAFAIEEIDILCNCLLLSLTLEFLWDLLFARLVAWSLLCRVGEAWAQCRVSHSTQTRLQSPGHSQSLHDTHTDNISPGHVTLSCRCHECLS